MALFKILKGDNALPKDKHDGWAYVRKTGDETADFYVDYSDTVRVQIGKYAQNGMYYINGTGTTAGTWLGAHQNITEYYDGLAILYRIPIAGASTTTLNINSLGAKTCYLKGTTKLTTQHAVNALVILVYDSKLNSNAGGWSAHTYYDTNTIPTAYCSTSAGTAAKTASQSSFKLKSNSFNIILIANANTAAGALTLNINSTGAKSIWINGKASSAENYTLPAGTYLIFYDGSKYLFYTDNTIPAKVISAEKVNQAADTTNKDFPVLLRALDTSNTTDSPAGVIFNTKIKANPSTGALSATYLYRNGLELTRIFGSLIPYGTRINPTENIVLNDPVYLKVGNYYCSADATAKLITDLPKSKAFMMQVLSPLSTTIDNESSAWVYRIRIIRFYTGEEYVQSCYTNADKVWSYGNWRQTIDSSILASTSQNGLMTSAMVTRLETLEDTITKKVTNPTPGTAVGSTTKPIYVNASGEAALCSTYAGGTKVTLNGSGKGASTASFYAPTGAGTEDQYLRSTGTAPAWTNFESLTIKITDSTGTETTKIDAYTPLEGATTTININDLLPIYSSTMTNQKLALNTWTNVTIPSNLTNGTYILQVTAGGAIYSGVMSWDTATTTATVYDEIMLHSASASTSHVTARVNRSSGLKLQLCALDEEVAAGTITIKMRRMI